MKLFYHRQVWQAICFFHFEVWSPFITICVGDSDVNEGGCPLSGSRLQPTSLSRSWVENGTEPHFQPVMMTHFVKTNCFFLKLISNPSLLLLIHIFLFLTLIHLGLQFLLFYSSRWTPSSSYPDISFYSLLLSRVFFKQLIVIQQRNKFHFIRTPKVQRCFHSILSEITPVQILKPYFSIYLTAFIFNIPLSIIK